MSCKDMFCTEDAKIFRGSYTDMNPRGANNFLWAEKDSVVIETP